MTTRRSSNSFFRPLHTKQSLRRGELKENDLVFVTNGRLVENSSWATIAPPATFNSEIRAREHLGRVDEFDQAKACGEADD